MRKWVPVFLLLLLLVTGAGTLWWATALPEPAARLEVEVLESLRRSDAAPPEGNGYQSLIKLWGPPWEWSAEETRLARYRRRTLEGTLAEVGRSPQRFAKELETLESYLDPLLVALTSPRIVWDSVLEQDPYDLEALRGFPGMRGVMSMLTVAGFYYLEEGHTDEGLRLILAACEFPARFSEHLVVVESLMRYGTQLSASAGLLEVLTRYQLDEAQLLLVSETLIRAEPKSDAFGRVMDTEYTLIRQGLGRVDSRRLAHFYLRHRERFYDPRAELSVEEVEAEADRAGITGLLKVPPCHLVPARQMHRVALTVFSAARLVVALQLHQRRRGSYPLTLEELDYQGEDLLEGGRPFQYQSDGVDFTLTSESPQYLEFGWYEQQRFYPFQAFTPPGDS